MNDTTTHVPLDAIERTVELPQPIERVWRAISDPAEIGGWFPNESATLDVRAGGTGELVWVIEGKEFRTEVHVHEVDEPRRFVWSWGHESSNTGDPVTTVEFTLTATDAGGTTLGRGARRARRVPRRPTLTVRSRCRPRWPSWRPPRRLWWRP